MNRRDTLPILLVFGLSVLLPGPALAEAITRVAELRALADELEAEFEAKRGAPYEELLERTGGPYDALRSDDEIELMFVAENGKPFYYAVENENAGETVNTFRVRPGAGFGFSLTGASTVLGELGIWDGGAVRIVHQEFTGRASQMDGAGSLSNHATHVAGTMIAAGVAPAAKGMSYEARLACHDWTNDQGEMAAAAASGLRVSNHSYGFTGGWRFDGSDWYWYGDIDVSTVEDYGFGFYGQTAQNWDLVAWNAPYYLPCNSAGNDRNDFGPTPGGAHFVWDGGWVTSNDVRDPDGGSDGYDCINWHKTAKNIMTVGAIEDIPGGFTQPGDVVMSSFSNWGPTDDGRIKPDLVANGVGLYSSTASGNSTYGTFSGTSMASPNLSGSANLIADYFEDTHGTTATAATLKGILIHTASEAGAAKGPDYSFGWGLLNTLGAAQLVQADSGGIGHVHEATLQNGAVDEYFFTVASGSPMRVTIVWTDPPGDSPPASLNPTTPMLVNDLDLRIEETSIGRLYEPWTLDPANPSAPATKGDNFRDNVEQVHANNLPPGDYVVRVTHEGTLDSGLDQNYSLISSRPISTTSLPTGVENLAGTSAISDASARPNPFRGSTTIAFDLPERARVTVEVYDVNGRRIRALERGRLLEGGSHRVPWDGRDEGGERAPAGVYFVRVDAGIGRVTEKLVLLGVD